MPGLPFGGKDVMAAILFQSKCLSVTLMLF